MQGGSPPGCSSAGPLLRLDAGTSGVVSLDDCASSSDGTACFTDECVPAGTYMYGLETPFSTAGDTCGTQTTTAAQVATTLPSDCTRDANATAPTTYTGTVSMEPGRRRERWPGRRRGQWSRRRRGRWPGRRRGKRSRRRRRIGAEQLPVAQGKLQLQHEPCGHGQQVQVGRMLHGRERSAGGLPGESASPRRWP